MTLSHWCAICPVAGDAESPAFQLKPRLRSRPVANIKPIVYPSEMDAGLRATEQAAERTAATQARARQRRKAREQAAAGCATDAQLSARWDFYGGKCWMCGDPAVCMDHVKPLCKGGSNWPANQRPACWPCNGLKGGRWPWPSKIILTGPCFPIL